MVHHRIYFNLILFAFLISNHLMSQLSGVLTVPGTYSSIASAINALNTLGVNGPTTINIAAGYTETCPFGGYALTATGTAINPIIFQKNGSGTNPLITAYSGGTNYPTIAVHDGIWRLVGSDYITIDGIDLYDPNSSNPATMEYGYGLFKANAADGCQFNTIKNCVITMSRNNTDNGINGVCAPGSKGISMMNTTPTNATLSLNITNFSGTNSNNMFYGNTIQNCATGIGLIGSVATSPFTIADFNNKVGLPSAGNTIINYGGGVGAGPESNAVYTYWQYDMSISSNLIHNNTGAGVTPTAGVRGIVTNSATSANFSITSNTITLLCNSSAFPAIGIDNLCGSSTLSNTVSISDNIIQNCTYTTATTGILEAIKSNCTASLLNINNNIITNNHGTGTIGYGIRVIGNTSSLTALSVNGNNISNCSASSIYKGTDLYYGIISVSNNTVTNLRAYSVSGIYKSGSSTVETYSANVVNNLNATFSTGGITGIESLGGKYKKFIGNTISSFSNTVSASGSSGGINYGIRINVADSVLMYQNKVFDFVCHGGLAVCEGIHSEYITNCLVYNNIIGEMYTPHASSGIWHINGMNFMNNYGKLRIYHNTIHINASSLTGSYSFSTSALSIANGTLDLQNNIISNTSVPQGTGRTYAFYNGPISYSNTSNNNLFYAGATSTLNFITQYNNTLAWHKTTWAPADSDAVTENVPFLPVTGSNPNFLNINASIPTLVENGGKANPIVINDFAGNPRNPTSPDIGAWEGNYTTGYCSAAIAGVVSSSITSCGGYSVTLNSVGTSTGSGSSYQWQFSNTAGGPYTNVIGGNGSNTTSYTTGSLTPGTYYYIFKAGCPTLSLTSTSNEATVTVLPSPLVTTTATTTWLCSSKNATITASGADTYTWSTSATTNSIVVSPTTLTTYSAVGTSTLNGCTAQSVITITVTPSPTITVAVSPTINLCSGSTATLAVSGTFGSSTYTWSHGPFGPSTGTITVNPTVTTTYTVVAFSGNGCSNSGVATVSVSTCTGIENFPKGNSAIKVFPNPITEYLFIEANMDLSLIEIYNCIGQVIESKSLNERTIGLSLEMLVPGIYLARIRTANGLIKEFRILKE